MLDLENLPISGASSEAKEIVIDSDIGFARMNLVFTLSNTGRAFAPLLLDSAVTLLTYESYEQ